MMDGRRPSIWDEFARQPGRIIDGSSGDVATDHYHRFREDIGLMRDGGVMAYRFSISWSRILPEGAGTVNQRGVDFYDRLVDTLLAAGIAPWPCLYHWDLPSELQRKGGWLVRDTAHLFADYARLMGRRLADRARHWVMLNEPQVVAILGHLTGVHAPGMIGMDSCLAAAHHQTLAQGLGLAALRADHGPGLRLGTVMSLQPSVPATLSLPDQKAALRWDLLWNRLFLDPLFYGRYADELTAEMGRLIWPGDMALTRFPVDFLGLNYYSRMHMRAEASAPAGIAFGTAPAGTQHTGMGWPVEPEGLVEQLVDLKQNYGNPPVYITENGASYPDSVDGDGFVADWMRRDFLQAHLLALHRAMQAGCDVRGYFVWTVLDNFEWTFGYTQHFGLVRVETGTLRRVPKASWRWYAEVARTGGLPR